MKQPRHKLIRAALLFICLAGPFTVGIASHAATAEAPARLTLSNGARVIVSEQHAIPMVVIQVLLDAGARRDPKGKEGLAGLTADLLTEGTKKRSASQISEAVDSLGASLDSGADTDYASVGLTVLSKDLDRGLDLLFDVLLQPSFPDAEIARRRDAALASIQAEQDNPGRLAGRRFLELVFPEEPYGHPVIGTSDALKKLKRSEIVDFYRRFYRPDQAIISISGDVSTEDIRTRLEAGFRDWKPGAEAPFVYPEVKLPVASVATIDKPLTQSNIILGHRGLTRNNPDYYAVTVMNFILGGGAFTSRLMDSVRVKGGLAYSVGSGFSVNKSPGSFQVSLQTKNASASEAIQRTCSEIERIREEEVSDEEISDAKLYLTGSFPLRLDSNAKMAGFLAQVDFFQLGDDYIERYAERINAVSKQDILRVARKYLRPEELSLVLVGNLAEAQVSDQPPCATAVQH